MMTHGGASHPAHSRLEQLNSGSTTAPYDMACAVWSGDSESESKLEGRRRLGIAHVLYIRQV